MTKVIVEGTDFREFFSHMPTVPRVGDHLLHDSKCWEIIRRTWRAQRINIKMENDCILTLKKVS